MRIQTSEPAYRVSMPLQRSGDGYPTILQINHADYVVTDYTREVVTVRPAEPADWRPSGEIDPPQPCASVARQIC